MFMRSGGKSLEQHRAFIKISQKESSDVAPSGNLMESPTTATDGIESGNFSSSEAES